MYHSKSRGKKKQLNEKSVFLFKEYTLLSCSLFTGHSTKIKMGRDKQDVFSCQLVLINDGICLVSCCGNQSVV
jgi:hypothetical protein